MKKSCYQAFACHNETLMICTLPNPVHKKQRHPRKNFHIKPLSSPVQMHSLNFEGHFKIL